MKILVAICALACVATAGFAETTARPTSRQLAKAMEEVSGRRIGRENVRVGVCHGRRALAKIERLVRHRCRRVAHEMWCRRNNGLLWIQATGLSCQVAS
jgi:hypothetical protein